MDTAVTAAITQALNNLQYGSIHLVVHDGRLVRIERIERIRLPSDETGPAASTGSSGDPHSPIG